MNTAFQLRKKPGNQRIMELIREHLKEFKAEPTDADCLEWALTKADEYMAALPKPRHPKPHKR